MEDDESADNYLRDELGRMRREAADAQEKIKELRKSVRVMSELCTIVISATSTHESCCQVSYLEAEKSDLERRLQKSPYKSSADQVDSGNRLMRSQIPMVSSSSSVEAVVKLRIVEQENERLIKKIRGLETQLQVKSSCIYVTYVRLCYRIVYANAPVGP